MNFQRVLCRKLPSRSYVIVINIFSSTIELLKQTNIIIGYASSEKQEDTVVNGDTNQGHFTVGTSSKIIVTKLNTVNVKTLERCFRKKNDSK